MTVTTRIRSPGRARNKPLKPLRGECRVNPSEPVVTTLVCHFTFAREAAGAAGTRHSLRPLFIEGHCPAKLGRIAPRECGGVSENNSPSFRGDAKHRTRNLEIPGLVLTHHPGMTESERLRSEENETGAIQRYSATSIHSAAPRHSVSRCSGRKKPK